MRIADLVGQDRRRMVAALVAVLAACIVVAIHLWISHPPPVAIMGEATDKMERALDSAIFSSVVDFTLWNRLNIAVQSAAILLGLTATVLTASATQANTERLKIATVSVTALTAALITVQSTFHLRENLHTDATAFASLVTLETDYIYARNHLAEQQTTQEALVRDTEQRLGRIRSERMMSLANIGGSEPEAPQTSARR